MTLILIDCENFHPSCLKQVFADYSPGAQTDAHGFCDFSQPLSWSKEDFIAYNITPHQVFHANGYKNAADMALARFAMERIFSSFYDELVIASSDSDFCDLMLFAKSRGIRVVCYASNTKLNPTLKLACDELRSCKMPKSQDAKDAKAPTKQPESKFTQNIERIKAELKSLKEPVRTLEFISVLRSKNLVAKKMKLSQIRRECEKIGIFIDDEFVFSSKAAKLAAKSAPLQTSQNPATPKSPLAQPARKKLASKDILPLFRRTFLEHKFELNSFLQLLKRFKADEFAQEQKLLELDFCVHKDLHHELIYPASFCQNMLLKSWLGEAKARLKEQQARQISEFAKQRAGIIYEQNRAQTPWLKRFFVFDKNAQLSALCEKICTTLEIFCQLASGAKCDEISFCERLAASGICERSKATSWLLNCAFARSEAAGSKIFHTANCLVFFDNDFHNEAKELEKKLKIAITAAQKPAAAPAAEAATITPKSPAAPSEKPAAATPKSRVAKRLKPDANAIAHNVARVQAIKHELGRIEPKELISALRERKIRPMDLGCPNWTMAFKKYEIFDI